MKGDKFNTTMKNKNNSKHQLKRIRAQTYMHAVFLEAGLATNTPVSFANFFESKIKVENDYGKPIISQKWIRNINGETLPSISTVKLINKRAPLSQKYYSSLLWLALKPGIQSKKYWLKFFQKLPSSFKRILRQGEKECLRNERIKAVNFKKIRAIYSYFNADALAYLIALLRIEQEAQDAENEWYSIIEQHVYALLLHHLSLQPYAPFKYQLFSYVSKFFFQSNSNQPYKKELWGLSNHQLTTKLTLIQDALCLADSKKIIKNRLDRSEFLFGLPFSQLLMVCWELANDELIITTKDFNLRSIHWLISEMNKLRPASKKLVI